MSNMIYGVEPSPIPNSLQLPNTSFQKQVRRPLEADTSLQESLQCITLSTQAIDHVRAYESLRGSLS